MVFPDPGSIRVEEKVRHKTLMGNVVDNNKSIGSNFILNYRGTFKYEIHLKEKPEVENLVRLNIGEAEVSEVTRRSRRECSEVNVRPIQQVKKIYKN
jgi:hypothetical protein